MFYFKIIVFEHDKLTDLSQFFKLISVLKSKTEIVEGDKCNQIVITEIPYNVVKSALVKKMSEVYVAKNIDGIITTPVVQEDFYELKKAGGLDYV